MEYYTVQEVSKSFNVSDRAIIHRCVKAKLKKKNGYYTISEKLVSEWSESRNKRNRNAESFFKTTIKSSGSNRSKDKLPNLLPNEVQVKNLSQHQNTALQNKVESLEFELSNYRKVLEAHSRIFKTINDKLEGVSVTTQQEMNRTRTEDTFFKTTVKAPKPLSNIDKPSQDEWNEAKQIALNKKLEKQFGHGVKHISTTKELPNENSMNDVGFGTRLHHLNKLEDRYPLGPKIPSGEVEAEVTTTRRNEDGSIKTTTETSTE